METIVNELKEAYASTNGCKEAYHSLLKCETKDDTIGVYKEHYQWCLENDFPDFETIKREFSDYEHENIYVGRKFNGETIKAQTVIFYNCTGVINVEMDYEEKVIPMLYFANDCDMKLVCKQRNIYPIGVPLYIFGENKIVAKDTSDIKFKWYDHNVTKR